VVDRTGARPSGQVVRPGECGSPMGKDWAVSTDTLLVLRGRLVTPRGVLDDGIVVVDGAVIVWVGPADDLPRGCAAPEPSRATILPGLVDLHCHGGGGASFPDAVNAADAQRAVDEHRRHGTTSLVASLVTAPADVLLERAALLAGLADAGEIVGIHLEGPFLSADRCGAQNPADMQVGDAGLVRRIAEAAGGHLVTMTVDEFWIGFRTGHLFFVLVPAVIVRGLLWLRDQSSRQLAGLVVAAVLLAGLPTTIIDAFNAQDVENTSEGIGLQWTLHLTPEQQAGLAWLRANTPPTAIVQAEPLVRGRDAWSLIPSFAERRMAAGEPISLLHVPDYDSKSDQVQRIYAYADAKQAWDAARELGIEMPQNIVARATDVID